MKRNYRSSSSSNGDWISVKSFKFPDAALQKLSVVYIRPESVSQIKRQGTPFRSTQSFVKPCSISSLSKHQSHDSMNSIPTFTTEFDQTSIFRSNFSVFTNFRKCRRYKKHEDAKKCNFEVLFNKKDEDLFKTSSFVTKKLHPNRMLNYYPSSINALMNVTKSYFSKTESKLNLCEAPKIKLQAWIPQALPSER